MDYSTLDVGALRKLVRERALVPSPHDTRARKAQLIAWLEANDRGEPVILDDATLNGVTPSGVAPASSDAGAALWALAHETAPFPGMADLLLNRYPNQF